MLVLIDVASACHAKTVDFLQLGNPQNEQVANSHSLIRQYTNKGQNHSFGVTFGRRVIGWFRTSVYYDKKAGRILFQGGAELTDSKSMTREVLIMETESSELDCSPLDRRPLFSELTSMRCCETQNNGKSGTW